jgi:hypothetical protein
VRVDANTWFEACIDHEHGLLSDAEVVELIQYLLSSGRINRLQGRYDRLAEQLLDDVLIELPGDAT